MNKITYEQYDHAMTVAYLEIGALKEKLRYSEERFKIVQKTVEVQTIKLIEAESILADKFELEWCCNCEAYTGTDYETTIKASIDGPEEGVYFCESCRMVRAEQ